MAEDDFQPGGYARALRLAFLMVLGGLLACVAYLQLSPTELLTSRSRREQTRLVYVPPCRGTLLDRAGNPLNFSVPSYSMVLRPELVRDPRDTRQRTLEKLSAEITDLAMALGPEFYQFRPSLAKIERHLREQPALPLTLWEDIDADTLARWALLRRAHPAAELQLVWRREYREPTLAPQLRGMVKRSGPRTTGAEKFWNANAPELAGASGLEKALDTELSGVGGSERLQTDVLSYRSTVLEATPAVSGADRHLALCVEAQRLAEQRFRENGYRGAAVALDLATGKVVVSLSMPAVPLGVRDTGEGGAHQNRVLSGYYPPGSTIKPLLALYALDRGLITAAAPVVDCPGYYAVGEKLRVGCSHVHGSVSVVEAIAQSCNVFFSDLAATMPPECLDDFAALFGFGQKPGSVLVAEESAGVPFLPGWVAAKRTADPTWRRGDAANAGIGQGAWVVTPMQLALATGFALTGELLIPQYLVEDEKIVYRHRTWSPEAQRLVLAGMRQCVQTGTGQSMRSSELAILGKTGTAEVGKSLRPHAWVTAAAPADAPRFVVAVCVENGGGGGRVAGPIARDILLCLEKFAE